MRIQNQRLRPLRVILQQFVVLNDHCGVAGIATGSSIVLGPLALDATEWGRGDFTVEIDAAGEVAECVEDDNTVALGLWPCL